MSDKPDDLSSQLHMLMGCYVCAAQHQKRSAEHIDAMVQIVLAGHRRYLAAHHPSFAKVAAEVERMRGGCDDLTMEDMLDRVHNRMVETGLIEGWPDR